MSEPQILLIPPFAGQAGLYEASARSRPPPIFLMRGQTGCLQRAARSSQGRANAARSSKTLDSEDDRTRWLARKMGAWVAGLFRPGRERRAPGKTGIRFRTGGPVATRIAGVYTAQ